jgi:hypothetical protein
VESTRRPSLIRYIRRTTKETRRRNPMKIRLLSLLALPLLVAVAAFGIPASETAAQDPELPEARLFAVLTGREEVPPPGDPDGAGFSTVTLDLAGGRVCYLILATQIGTATAAHIHRGPAGVAGPIVVPFTNLPDAASPLVTGCTTGVDRGLIQEIIANPAGFYVNVHNMQFPMGAIRGQLR